MGQVFKLAEAKLPLALECQRVFGEMLQELEGWTKVATLPSVRTTDESYLGVKASRSVGQLTSRKGGGRDPGTEREDFQPVLDGPQRMEHPRS